MANPSEDDQGVGRLAATAENCNLLFLCFCIESIANHTDHAYVCVVDVACAARGTVDVSILLECTDRFQTPLSLPASWQYITLNKPQAASKVLVLSFIRRVLLFPTLLIQPLPEVPARFPCVAVAFHVWLLLYCSLCAGH